MPRCSEEEALEIILREDAELLASLARYEHIESRLDLLNVDGDERERREVRLAHLYRLHPLERLEELAESDGIHGTRRTDLLRMLEARLP